MEVDCGSEVSTINKCNFDKLKLTGCTLIKSNRKLVVANGQSVSSVYNTSVFVILDLGTSNVD